MKRIEAERRIAALIYEIRDILKQYKPDEMYLSMAIVGDDYITANNEEKDKRRICFSIFDQEEGGE